MDGIDGRWAIESNHEALKRIFAELVAMAGVATFTSPLWGGRREASGGGDCRDTTPTPNPSPQGGGESGRNPVAKTTLPRSLYLAVLRILRPAESAARRLIIAAANGIVVEQPELLPRKPRKPPPPYVRSEITIHAGVRTRMVWQPGAQFPKMIPLPPPRPARARTSFSLLDTLRRYSNRSRRRLRPNHAEPRIRSIDTLPLYFQSTPDAVPVKSQPKPDDPIDATRLSLRLAALASALDDLPGQAQRFAHWQARRATIIARRKAREEAAFDNGEPYKIICDRRGWPIRVGRPPGTRKRRQHEIDRVLAHTHELAVYALEYPDTS